MPEFEVNLTVLLDADSPAEAEERLRAEYRGPWDCTVNAAEVEPDCTCHADVEEDHEGGCGLVAWRRERAHPTTAGMRLILGAILAGLTEGGDAA